MLILNNSSPFTRACACAIRPLKYCCLHLLSYAPLLMRHCRKAAHGTGTAAATASREGQLQRVQLLDICKETVRERHARGHALVGLVAQHALQEVQPHSVQAGDHLCKYQSMRKTQDPAACLQGSFHQQHKCVPCLSLPRTPRI